MFETQKPREVDAENSSPRGGAVAWFLVRAATSSRAADCSVLALGLAIGFIAQSTAATPITLTDGAFTMAQAMVPPTGMNDAQKPMPMEERMDRRFPQPVRVGDLIGLPMLDDNDSTIGFVKQVVRMPDGKIRLIVSYSRWFGWFGRCYQLLLACVANRVAVIWHWGRRWRVVRPLLTAYWK